MLNEEYEYADPNAASLMQSIRAFGYDISTAIADIVDNSITAKSTRIEITFEWNKGNPWIAIADNGYGMNEHDLFEAMKMGSKNPLAKREAHDLGRFGLGLKTASFSQCKRLTVATRQKAGCVFVRCWDLDIVTSENAWILLKKASVDASGVIDKFFNDKEEGTIVIWEKLDRIIPEEHIDDEEYQNAFLECASAIKDNISYVFSSYMTGNQKITFELNSRVIDMWDPFMTEKSTKMPSESLYVNGYEVKVKTYILPHQSKLSNEEFAINAGSHGWNAQQGFYIYRNNRLIVSADWLIPGMEKLEQNRLARIRIDIGNETDSEWNIDVRKSVAVPPISIVKELKRIALAAQRESAKVYKHRGKKMARQGKSEKCFIWHQTLRQGKIGYSINRDHPIIASLLNASFKREIKDLLNLVEETIPVPMIISDYSEKSDSMLGPFEGKNTEEFDGMLHTLFDYYVSVGCSKKEALVNIASTEPFIYAPEIIEIFREKEGIEID